MGTPLGPKYIPYTYIDPLGVWVTNDSCKCLSKLRDPMP